MRSLILPVMAAGALALGGCAHNYAGEGALAGGVLGTAIGAASGDALAGAAIGAAAGAAGGSLIHKGRRGCYYYDRNGHRHWTGCR